MVTNNRGIKMKKLIFLVLILSLFIYCGPKQGKVEKVMVDGVAHIMNPETPLKGTVLLDVEKTREINPYIHEEVDLAYFDHVRDTDAEVILFNPNKGSAIMESTWGAWFEKARDPVSFLICRFFGCTS
jgi:hypothetical protein